MTPLQPAFGAAGAAQVASGRYAAAWLIEAAFADGPLRLCTLPIDVPVAGATWRGVGQVLRVDPISSSEDGRADKIKLSLPITDPAMLALVLGPATRYRGRRLRIWAQVFSTGFAPVGEREMEWQGYMEPVKITRRTEQNGISGRIELPCSRPGLARSRNVQGLRVTHAQQQLRYPGDLACEYLHQLSEQPVIWLSKRFQEV